MFKGGIKLKDELITIGIFILLVCLFGWNSYGVNTKSQKVTGIVAQYESKENITDEDCLYLRKKWEEERRLLLYFTPHENIKQIDECVHFFCEYTLEGEKDTARYFIKKARALLGELARREKISLDNIF